MKLLDAIEVPGRPGRRVELCHGDLTALTPADAFDLLVVSAFPDNYVPTPSSLIGALHRKGLSVQALAADKSVDLRESFSCWLSRPFDPPDPGLRFRRVLVFEPLWRGEPPEMVGDIFRALTPIVAERPDIRTIALPVVAAGNQGYPVATMLAPLLDAALHWLAAGLPLERIKITTYRDGDIDEARHLFAAKRAEFGRLAPPAATKRAPGPDAPATAGAPSPPGPLTAPPIDYDVFISYSRANQPESEALEQALRAARPGLRIFVDRKEIDIGAAWQPEIFESLDRCHKVVAMLSPDYLGSKVCKEEFNIAWIRGRETDQDVIFPVYLYTAPLPTYMKYRNFVDCREGDRAKLEGAAQRLIAAIGP